MIGPNGVAPAFTALSDVRAFALEPDLDADGQPDATYPITLQAGASQLLGVRFSPWEPRDVFEATLIVTSDAPESPQAQISLRGAGVPQP